uniref:ARAD1D28490p n=1 Tax=Blastobotrys adeninivorans TaxID=409370 RepID=A0A060TBL1_BLAAD
MSLPIAPAPREQNGKTASFRIVTSKQWTLPPRTKPGRKPNKPPADGEAKVDRPRPAPSQEDLRSQLDKSHAQIEKLQLTVQRLEQELSSKADLGRSLEKNKLDDAVVSVDEKTSASDCGLCDSGGSCVCDELGIKPHYHEAVDVSKQFDRFTPMKAVPLKRRNDGEPQNPSWPKFKRLDAVDMNGASRTNKTAANGATASTINGAINGAINGGLNGDDKGEFLEESKRHVGGACGFCSDDMPCLCADDDTKHHSEPSGQPSSRPNTNPSSEPVERMAGSCSKCRQDPMSTLFCTSLASSAGKLNPNNQYEVTISCTDAYETLSRHRKFADTDLGFIVRSLAAENRRVGIQSLSQLLRKMDQSTTPTN